MRLLAAEKNISIGEFSNSLVDNKIHDNDDNIDISIDYKTCELIMNKVKNNTKDRNVNDFELFVLEGRQPAVMATFCQFLQSSITIPMFRIYLTCSIEEQAYRFFHREIKNEGTLENVKNILSSTPIVSEETTTLMNIANMLLKNKNKFRGQEDALLKFYDNAKRDENDQNRFYELYTKDNYYRNLQFYDCIIDTSNITEEEKINICKESFEKWLKNQ